MSLVSLLSGRKRWKSAEHVALSFSVSFTSFSLLASVSVFGTIQRRLACLCASVDTHQSRSVVKFMLHNFSVVNLLVALLWSGRGITGELLRNLKTGIVHVVI